MTKVLYDFLWDSFLFDDVCLESEFANVADEELVRELQRYREHVVGELAAIQDEVSNEAPGLAIASTQAVVAR